VSWAEASRSYPPAPACRDRLFSHGGYVEALRDAKTKLEAIFNISLARIIHEYRSEAFETEARRGFSQARPTQAYLQSVEEAEREEPRRARGSDAAVGIHE
jgi:hypothetical protein